MLLCIGILPVNPVECEKMDNRMKKIIKDEFKAIGIETEIENVSIFTNKADIDNYMLINIRRIFDTYNIVVNRLGSDISGKIWFDVSIIK